MFNSFYSSPFSFSFFYSSSSRFSVYITTGFWRDFFERKSGDDVLLFGDPKSDQQMCADFLRIQPWKRQGYLWVKQSLWFICLFKSQGWKSPFFFGAFDFSILSPDIIYFITVWKLEIFRPKLMIINLPFLRKLHSTIWSIIILPIHSYWRDKWHGKKGARQDKFSFRDGRNPQNIIRITNTSKNWWFQYEYEYLKMIRVQIWIQIWWFKS